MILNREKYIHEISISELSKAANISRTSFYTYYEDVYSVVEEMETEILDGFEDLNREAEKYNLKKIHVGNPYYIDIKVFEYIDQNREIFKTLLGRYGDPLFRYKYTQVLTNQFFRKVKLDYELKDDTSLHILRSFLVKGLLGVIEEWIFNQADITPETMERITTKLLYSPFLIQD